MRHLKSFIGANIDTFSEISKKSQFFFSICTKRICLILFLVRLAPSVGIVDNGTLAHITAIFGFMLAGLVIQDAVNTH
jgi:hypothetical protein